MDSTNSIRKILVITSPKPDLDRYISLYQIVKYLKIHLKQQIDIGATVSLPANFTYAISIEDTKIIDQLPPRKFLLEFKKQNSKVKNIQWSHNEDNLQIFVSMDKGNFNSDNVVSKIVGSDYQTIILIGIDTFTEIEAMYNQSPETFQEAKVISIGGKLQDKRLRIDQYLDEKHTCISEDTYTYLKNSKITISQKDASIFMAGILKTTDGFRSEVKSERTFEICAELVKLGGSTYQAYDLGERAFVNPSFVDKSLPRQDSSIHEKETVSFQEHTSVNISNSAKMINQNDKPTK